MKFIGKARADDLVEKGAVLIDMRSPVDYRDGHIEGAINLPLRNFVNHIMSLPKDKTILVYGKTEFDVDLKQGYNYAYNMGFSKLFFAEYDVLTGKKQIEHKVIPTAQRRPKHVKRKGS